MGVVVLAQPHDSVADVARKVIASAAVRVPPPADGFFVAHRGRVLDPRSTVDRAALAPLDRVDVRRAAAAEGPTEAAGGSPGVARSAAKERGR